MPQPLHYRYITVTRRRTCASAVTLPLHYRYTSHDGGPVPPPLHYRAWRRGTCCDAEKKGEGTTQKGGNSTGNSLNRYTLKHTQKVQLNPRQSGV